jgi:hypothetical protein
VAAGPAEDDDGAAGNEGPALIDSPSAWKLWRLFGMESYVHCGEADAAGEHVISKRARNALVVEETAARAKPGTVSSSLASVSADRCRL